MKFKMFGILIFFLAGLLILYGCEGPEGPAGPQGEPGEDVPQNNYLGDNANTCGHCHTGSIEQWAGTGHAEAYDDLAAAGEDTNLYCLQCHTTGFDSHINFGDTVITDPGPEHSGFDDYYPPQTPEDEMRADMLKGVQCETCHGSMGPTIYNHSPDVTFATRTEGGEEMSQCTRCHHTQIEEWHESGHGSVLERHAMTIEDFDAEFNAFSNCWTCHTAEGFIGVSDDAYASMPRPEIASLIGCVACHDPHDASNNKQLRNLSDVSVLYDTDQPKTFSDYGASQLCVQCHHARRDVDNVLNQIENGSAHFGPHSSPQMDMFLGSGSYEIDGLNYDDNRGVEHSMRTLNKSPCVVCHMELVESHGRDHYVHKLEVKPENCQQCHDGATDFDIGGVQTEVADLMGQLINEIGVAPESLGDTTVTTLEQRMAGYAYVFVAADGSYGVHNSNYSRALLTNAISFMQAVNASAGGDTEQNTKGNKSKL